MDLCDLNEHSEKYSEFSARMMEFGSNQKIYVYEVYIN